MKGNVYRANIKKHILLGHESGMFVIINYCSFNFYRDMKTSVNIDNRTPSSAQGYA